MAFETSTPLRITQTLGITASIFAAGANFALSASVVPRMLESPAPLMLKQWTGMMGQGMKTIIPLAVGSGAAWMLMAWSASQAAGRLGEKGVRGSLQGKTGRFVLAGILCVGIVPYTFIFLMPTNKKLFEMAGQQTKATGETFVQQLGGKTAHQLVDQWGMLNLPRAVMLLAGGVLGLLTVME